MSLPTSPRLPEFPQLIVALDFPSASEALAMAAAVRPVLSWAKVGLELFIAAGPDIVGQLKDLDYKVFLDLKFLDIPNTVKKAVRTSALLGADILDVHLTGGRRMLEAALEGASGLPFGAPRPLLFGITVLTSMETDDLSLYREPDPERLALDLARLGKDVGLDGAICSGFEVAAIKELCGPDTLCLTPGIRLGTGAAGDDQRRIMTPAQAAAAGSNFLVSGRPITGAASPVDAARKMMENLRSGTTSPAAATKGNGT